MTKFLGNIWGIFIVNLIRFILCKFSPVRVITWNINSRTKKQTLKEQCLFLENNLDIITLQEVTLKSQDFFKDFFRDRHILSSFDLVPDVSILTGKRKYGQLIISNHPIKYLKDRCINIPFSERVLSGIIENINLEIHTTHVPPGSSNGVIKVEHFEGFYEYLFNRKENKKIVTGDFNSPKLENPDGTIVTWGQKVNSKGQARIAVNPKWKHQCSGERWDSAERNIIQNHDKLDLKDVFRTVNGYRDNSFSWFAHNSTGRRYDHIFCSKGIAVKESVYLQSARESNLSDHTPLFSKIAF